MNTSRLYRIIFISLILGSFLIWLMLIFLQGRASRQFSIFFGSCGDFLADTLNVVGYSSQRDVYRNTMYTGLAEKAYPPITYMFLYFFSRLVNMKPYYEQNNFLGMFREPRFLIIFIIVIAIVLLMLYELLRSKTAGSQMEKRLLAASLILCQPMLFSVERANTIIATVIFLGFFVFYCDSESRVLRELALISLAAAAAFKITPAVFGILLLYRRSWKDAIHAVIYGILVFFLPFLFFKGGFSNITLMLQNVQSNLAVYSSAEGCTLYAGILSYFPYASVTLETVMTWVTRIVCLVMLVGAPFLKQEWEKVLAVTLVLVILPSHSGYYNLLYFIPVIILFFNECSHRTSDWLILVSFILICFDLKWDVEKYLNFHLAIFILTAVLLLRTILTLTERIRQKGIA